MKKHLPLLSLLAFTSLSHPAMANDDTPLLPVDSRIKLLTYDESDVYTITTKYGYQTNLVFSRGEEVQTISMGDRSLWQIIPSGNRLFIRPMDDDVVTNMTIITNRRSYQFDLISLPDNSDKKPIYVAQFRYPEEEYRKQRSMKMEPPPAPAAAVAPRNAPAASPSASAMQQRDVAPFEKIQYNFNYTYSGSDDWAPLQVFDDGRSTFIKHRADKGLPQLFVRDPDKTERKVTYFTNKDQIVVEEVAGELLLKYGEKTIAVYNETLNPR